MPGKRSVRRGGNTHPRGGVWSKWNIPAKAKLRTNVKASSWSPATLSVLFAQQLCTKAAKATGTAPWSRSFTAPRTEQEMGIWRRDFVSLLLKTPKGLQGPTALVGIISSKQVVPKAGPRALQAGTHLSSRVQPFLMVQMGFSSQGDLCCWQGRARHRAGSCCLSLSYSDISPGELFGVKVPPRSVPGAEPDLSSRSHGQGSPENPSCLCDQPKITETFLGIALPLLLSKAKPCPAGRAAGRTFPAQKPHRDAAATGGVGLTEGNSCRRAGACPQFRSHRSSHRTLLRSRSGVCWPRPPEAETGLKVRWLGRGR